MKNFFRVFLVAALLFAGRAVAQVDPNTQTPVTVFAALVGDSTSSYYAVITSAAGETIFFQVTGGTGTFYIDGTLDSETAVAADTATWTNILSSTTIPTIAWVTDPPPYVRVRITRTGGTFRVLMRGNGTHFRVAKQ
jgi:hypothetical protein